MIDIFNVKVKDCLISMINILYYKSPLNLLDREIERGKKSGKTEKRQSAVIETDDREIFFHTPWKDGNKSQFWSPPLNHSTTLFTSHFQFSSLINTIPCLQIHRVSFIVMPILEDLEIKYFELNFSYIN